MVGIEDEAKDNNTHWNMEQPGLPPRRSAFMVTEQHIGIE
jgi:hypothetical protein